VVVNEHNAANDLEHDDKHNKQHDYKHDHDNINNSMPKFVHLRVDNGCVGACLRQL
jgi:hypothetical protein